MPDLGGAKLKPRRAHEVPPAGPAQFAALVAAAALVLAAPEAGAIAAHVLFAPVGQAASDEFGISVAAAGDVNHDGYGDVIVGAWGNSAAGLAAGRAYVFFGGPAADTIPDVIVSGEAQFDQYGRAVAGVGDVNHDGFDDVIVGAWVNNGNGNDSGRAYLYLGGSPMNATADLILTGASPNDLFGTSVAGLGDVNGDSYDDFIVGGHRNDAGHGVLDNRGRAYVYFGGSPLDGVADLIFTGGAPNDGLGFSVAGPGDVNNDGWPDILVSESGNDSVGTDAGRAYVFFGGPLADNVPDLVLSGAAAGDQFGRWVAGGGDLNGDGHRDLAVGAPFNAAGGAEAGRVYVYFGGPGLDATADLILTGETAGDQLGNSFAIAGDVNGDGVDDLIAGASAHDLGGTNAGRAYVFLGGPSIDAVPDLVLDGVAAGDELGVSVAGAGDVNGDGQTDFVVGARYNDTAGSNAGRVYIAETIPSLPAVSPWGSLALVVALGGAGAATLARRRSALVERARN